MKLGHKLLLPMIVTALVATAGGALTAVVVQRQAMDSGRAAAASMDELAMVASMRERMGLLHASLYRTMVLIASMDEASIKTAREALPREAREIGAGVVRVAAQHPQSAALVAHVKAVESALQGYVQEADQAIDMAAIDPNTGVAAMQAADTKFTSAGEAMAALVAEIRQAEQVARADGAAAGTQAAIGLGLLSMVMTAAVVVGCAGLLRRMAAALQQASSLAEAVAAGDLSREPDVSRRDEIGDLQRSLTRMVVQLRGSLRTVREAATGTAVASSEIASGNEDLSNRTEQTAARLQDASSSMAELSSAVAQAAEAARQARGVAGDSSAVAERTGAMVGEIVDQMAEISQASRRIADITGVIDGIAFQTNLLALNAAVEAARAGEQGRGFAVVAGEVRNLARRSADAAREIKVLTGTSVEKVDEGARRVRDAGGAMGDLVTSVRRVNEIVADISERAGEQQRGIDLMHETVDELDRMTQQNAALVEQSAAAAQSMRQQAQTLAGVVAAFQLENRVAA